MRDCEGVKPGSRGAGRPVRRWVVGVVLGFFAAGSALGAAAPVRDFETRLQASVAAGEVTGAEAELYRLFAVRDADRLPPDLRTEGVSGAHLLRADGLDGSSGPGWIRCGTPILRAVQARLGELPPDLRAQAQALLEPPPPTGRTADRTAGKVVTHRMSNWILTDNFSIEWGPDLTDEDGTTPPTDADGNSVPDVVDRWASYFEASFGVIIGSGRFPSAAVDANLIPVYLGNSEPKTSLDGISPGTYAFTFDADPVSYIVVNNDFTFVPSNDAVDQLHGAMKITAAHELFHVIHFLYEPPVWNITADDWWLETSATWMEDEVFDSVNDYHQYFGTGGWAAFAGAGLPVDRNDIHYVTRAYGNVVFAKYLSEHVGGADSMRDVWTLIQQNRRIVFDPRSSLDVIDDSVATGALNVYAMNNGFSGIEDLYLGFAAANAGMDYEEGADYQYRLPDPQSRPPDPGETVPVEAVVTTLDHVATSGIPAYLGAAYVRRVGGGGGPAEISLSATDPVAGWGLALWVERAGGEPLALAATAPITLTDIGTADAYGIPAYLDPAGTPVSYTLAETTGTATDTTAPGALTLGAPAAVAGGFDLGWTRSIDADVAGYVVTWDDGAGRAGHRTLYGPVTAVEVRGLSPAVYTVEVYAYDRAGNADRLGAASVTAVVTDGPSDTPTPAAHILEVGSGKVSSGGGGGGGGCFFDALR